MTNVCEHGQLKRSCPLCEKDEEIMTLEQALQWAAKNCMPEAVGRLRSREVVATLVDEIASLRQRVADLAGSTITHDQWYAKCNEAKYAAMAAEEEAKRGDKLKEQLATCEQRVADLEVERDMLSAGLGIAQGLTGQLAACEKERDEYLTECRTLTRQNGEWQEKLADVEKELTEATEWAAECEKVIEAGQEREQQLRQRVAELVEIGVALDDPRTDLSMTMAEVIRDLKKQLARLGEEKAALATISGISLENAEHRQVLRAWVYKLKEQLAATEKERDELRQKIAECQQYLKDGETPAERMARYHHDIQGLLGQLATLKEQCQGG